MGVIGLWLGGRVGFTFAREFAPKRRKRRIAIRCCKSSGLLSSPLLCPPLLSSALLSSALLSCALLCAPLLSSVSVCLVRRCSLSVISIVFVHVVWDASYRLRVSACAPSAVRVCTGVCDVESLCLRVCAPHCTALHCTVGVMC